MHACVTRVRMKETCSETKETYKRDLQKRPIHETYKRDLQKRSIMRQKIPTICTCVLHVRTYACVHACMHACTRCMYGCTCVCKHMCARTYACMPWNKKRPSMRQQDKKRPSIRQKRPIIRQKRPSMRQKET